MNEDKAAKADSVAPYDKNLSPVGWYVASYLLRFIELDREDIDEPEARFQAWENTVLVKAKDMDEAYDKTVRIAMEGTKPYKGGPPPGIDVKWDFVGITELLPVYEDIKDGAEIMWSKHAPRKLKNLRKWVGSKDKFYQ